MKIEENERLAVAMTFLDMLKIRASTDPKQWRKQYQKRLDELIKLDVEELKPSCPEVGCEIPMPHEHTIEGPVKKKAIAKIKPDPDDGHFNE